MSQPLTRKTIAQRIGGDMTANRIKKNERRWGLDKCRAHTGTRAVLYDGARAMECLRRRGLA